MEILDDFRSNDVSVGEATIHLWGDLDRKALLDARVKPSSETLRAARGILESVPSALAREAFLARPLSRKRRHDQALAVRIEALRFTPRWDPFQSGVILSGLAESLLAVGRSTEALSAAREAYRHAPLDPYALRVWAEATGQTGAPRDAAAVRGWLRDAGYGMPIVLGPPTDDERTVEPSPPALGDLAPLDDEGVARYLVMMEVDEGFESKRYRLARHAMALIRRGELGLARNTAAGDDGDSGLATVLASWMNLAPADEVAWLVKDSIRRTLDATPEGSKARSGSRAKKPNRYWGWDALTHVGYRNQLVKEGDPAALEALLYCASRSAFVEGLSRLPQHPVVQRFAVQRDELVRRFPPAEWNQVNRGARATLGVDGKPVSFPEHDDAEPSEFPPRFEAVEDARIRCQTCKKPIEKDGLALRVGRMSPTDGEPKFKRFHVACAADQPSLNKHLRQALERERRSLPELTDLAARWSASSG